MSSSCSIDKDWSCALEAEEYEKDINLLIKDAIKAIDETAINHYVNLVTHSAHGHPENYLLPILEEKFGKSIETKFVDQCGCGGYVFKVTRK